MKRGRAGYTFVELLIVMTILGIMTGIAYLRIGPAFNRARVRGAASMISTDLKQAQMLSVRFRRPVVFQVTLGNMEYEIRDRPGDTTYIARTLGTGTDFPIDELLASSTVIEFFPNGITGTDASITLGIQGYRRRVTVTRAGQIRVRSAP